MHGNLRACLNPDAPLRVMIEGHCDEIGFMVQYIDDDGYAGPFSPAQQIALPCRTCYATGGSALLLWLLL